ncbi:MAG: UDP-N-acetylmuramate--L-alanine ligase [bacterium]|nr:UDP-N-acetylmuramate--L-alanine ligase [bacterium]
MFKIDFSKIKTVHFIGIGGIGTSAVARMFLYPERSREGVGISVSGSDVAESEVTEELRKLGAKVSIGQRAENVPADCDLVIYTIAVTPDNPEFAEAKKRGIPMLSYPEVLGIISKEKYTIAISGTHGKTTTTAMIAKIMIDAGLDPTVIVGSFLNDTKTNFIAGKSKYLVVEACEYRRSFLNLSPKILVITNIDADHLDYYKDLDDIKSAFAELAAKVPKDGFIVGHPMFEAPNIGCPIFPTDFTLKVPGKHNLENAKAALAVARALKIPEKTAFKSLSEFSGTWRRFEYRGKAKNGALVYDDYGHHPTEISATLQGARELFPTEKIVVVFQPHLYSRTKQHLSEFGKCFSHADAVILLPIYPAREQDPGNISSEMVVTEIKKNNRSAYFVKTFAEAAVCAQKLSCTGDLVLTLGAGETNKVADILVSK